MRADTKCSLILFFLCLNTIWLFGCGDGVSVSESSVLESQSVVVQTTEVTTETLKGKWESECLPDEDGSTALDVEFTSNQDFLVRFTSYSDQNCSDGSQILTQESLGSFFIGDLRVTDNHYEVTDLDIEFNQEFWTLGPHCGVGVARGAECLAADIAQWEAKDAGLDFGSEGTLLKADVSEYSVSGMAGTTILQFYRIDGDTLRSGTSHELGTDGRPLNLNLDFVLYR